MSENVGHVSFDLTESPIKPYSEATGSLVDSEVRKMLEAAMERTLDLLKEKKEEVERLAELLLDQEVLEREDMVRVLGERPWAEKTSYDDFVVGAGGSVHADHDTPDLPAGLQGWDSPVRSPAPADQENREDENQTSTDSKTDL